MIDRYFESTEFKDLLARYENALSEGNSIYLEPDELTDIADYYLSMGQPEAAKRAAHYALSIFPSATAPLEFLAHLSLSEDNDIEQAICFAEQIDDKTDIAYFYIQAEILLAQDKPKEADLYLDEHYEHIDENERADFIIDCASLFADYNHFLLADKWLQRSDETEETDYRELKGRIAFGTGRYKEAETIFNGLIDEDPYSVPYWNRLAQSQHLQGHISESITSSEYSIAINPDDEEAILNKGHGLFSLGNYEEALSYYQKYKQLRPEEDTGDTFIGMTLAYMNQPEQALVHFLQAEKLAANGSQNMGEIYQQTALVYSYLGQADKAHAYIDKAMDIDEMDKDELIVQKGRLFLEEGQPEEASRCFITALHHSAGSTHLMFDIAVVFYDCGYVQMAYKMFITLITADLDGWDDGYAYLAACCYDLHRKEDFLKYLKTACEKNPQEARYVLSDLFPTGTPPEDYYEYAINHPLKSS